MPTLTPEHAGMSRSAFYRAAHKGAFDRIARGIYLPADATVDYEQLEAVTRRPEATICLTSALAHYDLTDEIPQELDAAIPRGIRKPATTRPIAWHWFDRDTFDIGRETMPIEGADLTIGIYSAERTIADCFRLRNLVGYEASIEALKEWLRRGGKPARLLEIAKQLPRAERLVREALVILQ